jgi:hypothetical protein
MKTNEFDLAGAKALLSGWAKEGADLKEATNGALTTTTADWVVPHYVLSAREELMGSSGERRLEILRGMVRDLAWLRRGDLSSARLELQREELEWKRTNSVVEKEKEFRKWLESPKIQEELYPSEERCITLETIEKMEKALNLM